MSRKGILYSVKDGMKACADCGVTKPVSEFYRKGDGPKVDSYCKPCKAIRKRDARERFAWHFTAEDIAKFWANTRREPSGCIVWTSYKNSYGYGQFYLNGKQIGAHRVALVLAGRPLPLWPMVPDHECRNRACVNEAHLREVTQGDNANALADRPKRRAA